MARIHEASDIVYMLPPQSDVPQIVEPNFLGLNCIIEPKHKYRVAAIERHFKVMIPKVKVP
jgi:hypothetical protein